MGEALVLVANDDAFVVLNRYPFAAGHLLVIPTRHVGELCELTDGQHDALFRLVRETAKRLERAVSAEGLNIGINVGCAAGAGLAAHLHVHVVPRWNGDFNFMPVVAGVTVMPQHLRDTFSRLHPHFVDIPGRHAKTAEPGSR